MPEELRYVLAPDVVFKPTGDEALLLKLNDETMFALNASGARIVQLLLQDLDLKAVVETLAEEFHASASEIEADATRLLGALTSGGLMEAVGQDRGHV
jgi:hypothetical protein